MEIVKQTSEYTIYQKRSKRYAVKNAQKKAVNGDEKVKILVAEKLLKVPLPKPKEEEASEQSSEEAKTETSEGEEVDAS